MTVRNPVRPEPGLDPGLSRAASKDRRAFEPHPQPLAQGGERRDEYSRGQDELDAAREWLAHVEAGRIG